MAGNRCVVYVEPGKVSVESIDYPKLELPEGVPGGNRKGIVNLPKNGISGILYRMNTPTSAPNYKGYRFPPEIISHAVWLYFRFSLSFRDLEELLAQPAIVLTY